MEQKKTPPKIPPKKAGFIPSDTATSNPAVEKDRATNRPKFVKGNQLWQTVVLKRGVRPIITDAFDLWEKAIAYFNWCDNNPLSKSELVKHQGDAEEFSVTLGRPYSMDALTIFIGVSGAYFRGRKATLTDKEADNTATTEELELLDTIHLIESVVRNQRFDGAAVGIFKENLISRVDGYADNINQNNTGEVRQNIVVRDQNTADNLKKLDEML